MNIEKLIEKDIKKIPLPNGFEKGPIYKFIKKVRKENSGKKINKNYLFEISIYPLFVCPV